MISLNTINDTTYSYEQSSKNNNFQQTFCHFFLSRRVHDFHCHLRVFYTFLNTVLGSECMSPVFE